MQTGRCKAYCGLGERGWMESLGHTIEQGASQGEASDGRNRSEKCAFRQKKTARWNSRPQYLTTAALY